MLYDMGLLHDIKRGFVRDFHAVLRDGGVLDLREVEVYE